MTVVSNPVSAPADRLSEAIARLRSLTQCSIQDGWRYCDEDLPITQATQPDTWHNWTIAPLNEKNHIAWTKGEYVRWLGQLITVPHDLQQFLDEYATLAESLSPLNPPILGDFDSSSPQSWGARGAKTATGYPLEGLTLRLAVTWWANNAQLFVNGKLVQEGDIFDCVTRILLSEAVTPGDTFAIALRLVSPGHDDGALVRSVCHYESSDIFPEPSFIADELEVLRLYLQTFAPEKLPLLTEAVTAIDWSSLIPHPSSPPLSLPPSPSPLTQLRDRLLPLSPLLKQRRIRLLGHAHLDMAWLWTVAETWNAAERTFESALKLQKYFPELIFCHSTPALYEWIEQNRPALFEQIRQAIADGWWEPVGGLWIEPELNIISGESMVRQVLYGQRYFQEKFGSINRIAWLPDSFGFTWQLPQILKQGGIDYFVTQKLRWNDTTKFPYEVFQWQAPDRTEIFSLMSAPIGEGIDPIKMATYACDWETKTGIPDVLWLPGVGDHGGGPTRDMLEIARRWQQSPFFPQLEFSTALDYLQDLEAHYKPDTASSAPDRVQNRLNEPQSINAEAQSMATEPQSINHEARNINVEPQNINGESQNINGESQNINAEAQTFTDEAQNITRESQSINAEPQNINSEAQNSKLSSLSAQSAIQNSKLSIPHTPHPIPHTLPLWHSDLYLEFHRGCYTTHADQKQFNRQSEELLYQAELWASLATISVGADYPKAELEAAWKKVLLNQFHDILPGSSITEVFEDANKAWKEVYEISWKIREQSYTVIAQQIAFPQPPHPEAQAVAVFNPRNWKQSRLVMAPTWQEGSLREGYGWQVYDMEGHPVQFQECSHNPENPCKWVTFLAEDIPAIGYRCFWLCPYELKPSPIISPTQQSDTALVLENEFLRVTINPETGDLASVFDKVHQHEVLSGSGNQLQAFHDRGQYWDAWNIDPDYAQYPLPPAKLLSIYCRRTLKSLQQHICVDRAIGDAKFKQTYTLYPFSKALEIYTHVVFWHERHVMVKAAFPLNLEASFATYEIPCGAIKRTTQPQTDAEKAKWEVPALRWADLSDNVYGVSLLNDCKYGYDVQSNQIRLTLLRSSTWPDPYAEIDQPGFTYVLYPHSGSWQSAKTVQLGYELNQPNNGYWSALVKFSSGEYSRSGTLPSTVSLFNLGADNLVLMAFKQSEGSPDEWILRCYEAHGEEAQLDFQSDLGLELGERIDLLERSTDPQTTKGQTVTVRPWEIASFKVKQSATSNQRSAKPQA